MGEEISTQFKTEGEPAFPVANEGDSTPPDSSPGEQNDSNQTPSSKGEQKPDAGKQDGGDKGFADHPRWIEREEQWKGRFNEQEERHAQEIQKLREEFLGKGGPAKPAVEPEEQINVPEWFGGDEAQYRAFLKDQEAFYEKAEQRARAKIEAERQEQQKRIDEATAWMNSEVAAIEADKVLNPSEEKIDRNKLFKFVHDNDIIDSQGRWNYRIGWQLLRSQSTNPTKTEAAKDRKQLAAAATANGQGDSGKTPAFATAETFEHKRPW